MDQKWMYAKHKILLKLFLNGIYFLKSDLAKVLVL